MLLCQTWDLTGGSNSTGCFLRRSRAPCNSAGLSASPGAPFTRTRGHKNTSIVNQTNCESAPATPAEENWKSDKGFNQVCFSTTKQVQWWGGAPGKRSHSLGKSRTSSAGHKNYSHPTFPSAEHENKIHRQYIYIFFFYEKKSQIIFFCLKENPISFSYI